MVLLSNLIFTYITRFEKIITIDEKFAYGQRNGKSQSVSDKNNNVYEIRNSVYLFHFTSAEVFNNLDIDSTFKVKGYGYRIPVLGMFPNIYHASIVKA
jgi:hypothetical protein